MPMTGGRDSLTSISVHKEIQMLSRLHAVIAMLCIVPAVAAGKGGAGEIPIRFESDSGEIVEAFQGEFSVPENRSVVGSRTLTIRYVRFPATGKNATTPIVYLAGGPGGSGIGTARGRRFPLFMAMRTHGDVIALDQRGTGDSTALPGCVSSLKVPQNKSIPDADFDALHREAAKECARFWESEGVDIRGYTTRESVEDLDALRRHLAVEKISLWGISYGSHLALAAMKYREDMLEKVIIASAEGLDQTVKLPAHTDAYFQRLQSALQSSAGPEASVPDLVELVRRVHSRLDESPVELAIPQADGTVTVAFDRRAMQQVASYMVADPERATMLTQLYVAMDQGYYAPVAGLLARFYDPDEAISYRAMPLAMDIASGIGQERLRMVTDQARTSLLGDMLNFPMPHMHDAIDGLDLGEEFRSPPSAAVPTLLLTGTLDGRTYVEGQAEAVKGLTNLTQVMVVNAGHNLFMSSPEVGQAMDAFMRGEAIPSNRIVISPPAWK